MTENIITICKIRVGVVNGYKEKTLLVLFFCIFTTHRILYTPNICAWPFLYQAILGHQLGTLQFNSILTLPGVSIRSHSLRAQSHNLLNPQNSRFRCQCQIQVVTCASGNHYKWNVPTTHFPGLINILEWLPELRKTFSLL